MERKEYYLKIAEKVFPELKSGKFFTNVKGVEHYFSGLLSIEVKNIYKSFYDEFDYAFSIRCTFSLSDRKSDTRWIRQEGSEHCYTTPVLFVVDRLDMDYEPEQVVRRMLHRYRANTIILESFNYYQYHEQHLAEYLRRSGVHLIWKKELDAEAGPIQHLIRPETQMRRLNSQRENDFAYAGINLDLCNP